MSHPPPPWAEKILTKYWGALVARGAPIPRELDTSTAKRRKAVGYGCGHYGCVMPTHTAGIVCKITSDQSEARFIRAALSLGKWPDGIVKYHAIYVLPETHKRRPVFIVYREELFDGLLLLEAPDQRGNYQNTYNADLLQGIMAFKLIAHEVRTLMKRSTNMTKTLSEVFSYGDWARDEAASTEYIEKMSQVREFLASSFTWKGARRMAVLLAKCHDVAEHLWNNIPDGHVGQALSFYLEHNILLADVHAANVGRVPLEGYDEPQWVISDPGHAVFLTDQYESLLIEAL